MGVLLLPEAAPGPGQRGKKCPPSVFSIYPVGSAGRRVAATEHTTFRLCEVVIIIVCIIFGPAALKSGRRVDWKKIVDA